MLDILLILVTIVLPMYTYIKTVKYVTSIRSFILKIFMLIIINVIIKNNREV